MGAPTSCKRTRVPSLGQRQAVAGSAGAERRLALAEASSGRLDFFRGHRAAAGALTGASHAGCCTLKQWKRVFFGLLPVVAVVSFSGAISRAGSGAASFMGWGWRWVEDARAAWGGHTHTEASPRRSEKSVDCPSPLTFFLRERHTRQIQLAPHAASTASCCFHCLMLPQSAPLPI